MRLRTRQQSEKYQYVIDTKQRWLVRIIGLLGAISTGLLTYGYYRFLRIDYVVLALLSIPFLIIVAYWFVNYISQLFFPGFDLDKHKSLVKNYWAKVKKADVPEVTVFVPAAGESDDIVEKTLKAATAIDYPNFKVYLLDDTKAGIYKALAKKVKVEYLNRPEHKFRKAGNLQYAFEKIAKTDYILILDADFVARKEMLKEMVPYATDGVGIVQTPQHFDTSKEIRKSSPIEFASAYIQKEFYRIGQVARGRFNSSICVGTNALYSYKALEDAGGFELVDYAEDVRTGIAIINFVQDNNEPYKIKYVPVQLAKGIAPKDYFSFFKQQSRWSMGGFRFMFSRKTLFSSVLHPTQKVLYFSNSLYYLYIMATLSFPFQFLLLSLLRSDRLHWVYLWFFIPQLVMIWIIMPLVYRRGKHPSVLIVTVANAYTFLQSLFMVFVRHVPEWSATGTQPTSSHKRYHAHRFFSVFYYLVVYVGTLAVAVLNESFGKSRSYIIQALFVLALFAQTIHLLYLFFMDSPKGLAKKLVGGGAMVILLATLAITIPIHNSHQIVASAHPLSVKAETQAEFDKSNSKVSGSQKQKKTTSKSQAKATTASSTGSQQAQFNDVAFTVQPGDTISSLTSSALLTDFKNRNVQTYQLGYIQNYLMKVYGYGELSEGSQFVVRASDVSQGLKYSYGEAKNASFWTNYANEVGLTRQPN